MIFSLRAFANTFTHYFYLPNFLLLIGVLLLVPVQAQGTIIRVSIDSAGVQGNNTSELPSVSSDGRYVVFYSSATNLVLNDTNGSRDVFVRDIQAGTTSLVSSDSAGVLGNSTSMSARISDDGIYVAFQSDATNLITGDTNLRTDVFIKNIQTGAIGIVSTDSAGQLGNGTSGVPSISSDGRYVAFQSGSSDLVPEDTNGTTDIFVKDTQTGAITRVNTDSSGQQAGNSSSDSSISGDGRYVAFRSISSSLVTGDTNGYEDIFIKDTLTGSLTLVSSDSSGIIGNHRSYAPAISSNGRYVTFYGNASNLVADDTNGIVADVFVKDTQTGITTLVSRNSSGEVGGGSRPKISSDGRYVIFQSTATNLVSGDTNRDEDVFVKDTQNGLIRLISRDSSGVLGNDVSNYPNLSSSGEDLVFTSFATNLVSGDTNGRYDAFHTENPLFIAPTIYRGDINDDEVVDLADAILALKALAWIDTFGQIRSDYTTSGADANGDDKIGLEDVIYVLQRISLLRQ